MTQHKIILITDFSKPWNNGWYYKSGFEKNGFKVIPFDPKSVKDGTDKIAGLIKEQNPAFILHTKFELPSSDFEYLRRFTKVIQWYPDPVIPENLPGYVKASDVFLTMSEGLIEEFYHFNKNVCYLSQAFEPSYFDIKEISGKDRKIFSADVAFVGNLGSQAQYLMRRQALEHIINAGFQLKWWGPRIPRKISTIPLIFGKLGKAYGGKFIWGEEYARVAQLSKIFIAFDSMPHIRKSMSARMYTAVGCGAFYLCRHVDGIEDVLMPDREIVTFRDEDEMMDKIKFYLINDLLREKIAAAGRERVLRDHTYEVRVRQMLEIIKNIVKF